MLNETQHKVLLDPRVQMLIERLDCEVADTRQPIRTKISNRVQSWITSAQNSKSTPRIIPAERPASQSDQDIKTWTDQMKAVHGPNWTPFIIALLFMFCMGMTMRQPAVHPRVAWSVGKVEIQRPGASKPTLFFSKHNESALDWFRINYFGQKHLFLSHYQDAKGYLVKSRWEKRDFTACLLSPIESIKLARILALSGNSMDYIIVLC